MNAKIHPKVVVAVSTFKKLVDGTIENPATKFFCKNSWMRNEPWLLIGSPNRDPFLVTQYLEGHSASSDQPTQEDIDVTSQRSSCDNAVLNATTFY